MIFTDSAGGAFTVEPTLFSDDRGWFARFYCKNEFAEIGHTKEWVQMNHSVSKEKGTLRGMHFQHPPFREIKLVRCIAGAVYDVIVDLRRDSSTFLQWFGIELSAENHKMLYIPRVCPWISDAGEQQRLDLPSYGILYPQGGRGTAL
jgi:dTDP-4-dehydrorhamnose 3,5-epimerase